MIIVKGRELLIPENERYIGTNYDAGMENRLFRIPRYSQSGTDLSDLTFKINLIFDGDPLDRAEMTKAVDDDYIYLTWIVTEAQVAVTGTAFVCVTGNDTNDTVKWSTFQAAFYTEKSLGDDIDTAYHKLVDRLDQEIEDRGAAVTAEANARQAADTAEATARQNADATLQQNIDAEAAARTAADAAANTRIDNIVAQSGDNITEIVDARTGADNVVHASLKARLDSENTQLKNSFINTLIDNIGTKLTSKFRVNYANISSEGVITAVSPSGTYVYDMVFFPVTPGSYIKSIQSATGNFYYGWFAGDSVPTIGSTSYNSSRTASGSSVSTLTNLLVPNGVKWLGVRTNNHGDNVVVIQNRNIVYLKNNDDADNCIDPGVIYYQPDTVSVSNVPTPGGWLIPLVTYTGLITQIYLGNKSTTNGQVFVRKYANSAFSDWVEIARKEYVDAAISAISEVTRNLFDRTTIENGKSILSDGSIINSDLYFITDYIPVDGTVTIYSEFTGTFDYKIAKYNSNKVFDSRVQSSTLSNGKAVYSLAHTGYIRVVFNSQANTSGKTNINSILIVNGIEAYQYIPHETPVDYTLREETEHIVNQDYLVNLLDEEDNSNILTGGLYSSVGWVDNETWNSYIAPVVPLKKYYTTNVSLAIGVLDENKQFLQVEVTDSNGVFYTSNVLAKYVSIPFKADLSNRGKQMFVYGDYLPSYFIRGRIPALYDHNSKEYIEDTIWRGKTWVSFGTSMEDIGIGGTAGNNGTSGKWPLYIDGISGLIRNNQAVGGGGICPSTSGQGSVKTRVLQCPYDCDLVTIEAGPNDWAEIPLGEIGDNSNDTFLGNLRQCYEYLTTHTRARVVSICITNSNDAGGAPFHKNTYGFTYRDYMNGVIELSKYYGIENIDVSGNILGYGRRTSDMLKDHIHYTDLGGDVVGEFIWNRLKNIAPYPRFLKEEAE